MDAKAYEKVRRHIEQIVHIESIPSDAHAEEWRRKVSDEGTPEAEAHSRLNAEMRKWPAEQQDLLATIAASENESSEVRCCAMESILSCNLTRHTNLLVRLLQDPQNEPPVRRSAAFLLGLFRLKESLLALYGVAMSTESSSEAAETALYDICIMSMHRIACANRLVRNPEHRDWSEPFMYRRWWQETQPTEEMIVAWSRGEPA